MRNKCLQLLSWVSGAVCVRDAQSVISDYFSDQDPRVCTAAIKAMKFTCTQLVFGSIAFKLTWLKCFRVAFHKLPTITRVNFGPFLLTELV
uniref:Uncharacterized protein n=1 Tax=Oncorhynchus mykiss TaxID=8022 RepID=A0A8C7U0Y1_ONCMY